MARKPYPSDLTDVQWREIERLIPPARAGGRPREVDMRQVLCGIFYVLQNGGTWAAMPHDLPSGKTCWFYFNRFAGDGTWERLARAIYPAARARAERDPEPSEAVMDAQSVKTTKKGGRRAASVTMRARR
jgi:putative transposase